MLVRQSLSLNSVTKYDRYESELLVEVKDDPVFLLLVSKYMGKGTIDGFSQQFPDELTVSKSEEEFTWEALSLFAS
jgi:hypothetical protein